MVYKVYADVTGIENMTPAEVDTWLSINTSVAYDKHIYNLQNRLAGIEKYSSYSSLTSYVDYKYNDDGIRVEKDDNGTVTTFLIDSYNHTGYAQTLEEYSSGSLKTFTIADDMLSEAIDSGTAKHLLYDGHGSTRQLVSGSVGSTNIIDDFSYDGYGVLLQDDSVASSDPGYTPQQATNLLYAGEHFDVDSQQYYNRARWYNPMNGLFNRMDPYAGSPQDPQSLHKYLYCHANPVNGVDPSGKWNIVTAINNLFIRAMVMVQMTPALMKVVTITGGILAIVHLYMLATDPEAVDVFVASCGGDLTMVSGIIAMDIKALGNLSRMIGSTARNIITIRHLSGSIGEFSKKANQVQNAARNGGLVYVGNTTSRRSEAKLAQQAYRRAVNERLTRWFMHKGMSQQQAAYKAKATLERMHVDHRIGLQVSGALENPNNIHNLGMLEDSVNTSVGKQIQLECKRLGLQPGDVIDEVIVVK